MKALDAALKFLDSKPFDHEVAKAKALIIGYNLQWAEKYAAYEVVAVEEEFRFPLINPDTEGTSKTFDEAGKIDLILRHKASGRHILTEHKTTVDSIEPGSDYWDKLAMDTQCSKYILAWRQRGHDLGNLLYDVIHKPGSRPRQIAALDDDGKKIVLDASGQRVKTKDGKKWRESGDTELGYVLQTVQETPEQYFERLKGEIEADLPRYFAQREVPRFDTDLLEYMSDAWALSQQILIYRRADLWPRNPAACSAFGTCEFFDLCAGRASVDGIRYRESVKHRELSAKEEGKELLTNSRLTALRKCARYHFHRYEKPIEPVKEESDALRFGTLMHNAMEAYFNALKVA